MSDQLPPGASSSPDSPTVGGDSAVTPVTLAGKYRVERVIGEGSFGRVYLATDPRVRRNVAVKELLASRQTDHDAYSRALERFQREARAAGVTQHPNIVSVYELAVNNADNYYLVMEYIDGTDLRALLAQVGTLPPERAISITLDIARALDEIYAQDIVHRDLKPANIMLTRRGVAKLTDFGVAQVGSESQRTTVVTGHPGTPMYMSPEQSHSTGYLDGRSDLYSLGLVAYEMLVGTPYARSRVPLETARPDLPASLVTVVNRLIQTDPDDRYPDAAQLVAALESLSSRRTSFEPMPLTASPADAETRVAGPGSQGAQGPPGTGGQVFPVPGAPPSYTPSPPSYGYNNPPQIPQQQPPAYYGATPGQSVPPLPNAPYGNYPPPPGPGYGSSPGAFGPPPQGPPPYNSPYTYSPPPQPPPASSGKGRGPLIAIVSALVALLVVGGIVAATRAGGNTITATATPGGTPIALVNATMTTGTRTTAGAGGTTTLVSIGTVANTAPATPAMNTPTSAPALTNTAPPAQTQTPAARTPVPPTPLPLSASAPAQPTPRPASPMPMPMPTPGIALTTWAGPDGRLKLQFPSTWTISRGTDDQDNILRLDGPDGVRLNVYQYKPGVSLLQEFQDFRSSDLKCADASSMCGVVMDVMVGAEPAKYSEGGFSGTNGDPTAYAYWLVDHLGVRYEFELLNVGKHRAEGQALINSVVFLTPTKPTTTVAPKPVAAAITTWTDFTGTVRLQHPTLWKETLDTTNSENVLKLTADSVSIYVNVATPSGTLDDEIAYFRKTHGDVNKQFTYTYNTPVTTKVAGEPAKSISYSYVIANDPNDKPSVGTYYVVDHKGQRYTFQCSDFVPHRAEIEALIASVMFLK